MEYHMKGEVDGLFGVLQRRASAYAATEMISKLEKLVEVFKAAGKKDEFHEVLVPKISKEEYMKLHTPIRGESLPLPVKSAYWFRFKHADARRSSVLGLDQKYLTGIKAPQ